VSQSRDIYLAIDNVINLLQDFLLDCSQFRQELQRWAVISAEGGRRNWGVGCSQGRSPSGDVDFGWHSSPITWV